ncbi:MAG: SusC/RagA family TonB-linked outer membrane protein [Syntrophomonas sp.]
MTMQEDAIGIEEVVAIGYGTKSKATLTGAASLVDQDQLDSRPTARATDLLQGMVAGVQITRSNSGRIKGTNSAISIRGLTSRSDPGVLIIIDGIAQKDNSTYTLDNINPNDIESVSILKDAQAAIYGSRAAGGVILVTTKKGQSGKPTIEFSTNYTLQVPGLRREGTNILELVEMHNEAYMNDGNLTNGYTHIAKYIADNNLTMDIIKKNDGEYATLWPFDNSSNFVFGDYDWSKIMYGTKPQKTYDISVSGKSEKYSYYNSIRYVDQQGMLNYGQNSNKRLFVKLKNDYQINSYLKVKSNFDFENQKVTEPYAYESVELWQGLIWPVYMPFNQAGHLYNFGSHQNPIGYARDAGNTTDLNYRFRGLVGFELSPLKNLNVTGEISESFDIRETEWAYLGFDMYNENDVYSYNSTSNRNSAGKSYGRSRYTVANLYANYDLTLADDHKFTIMAGYSHEEEDWRSFSAQRNLGLIDENLPTMGAGSSEEQYNSESMQDNALESFFSRLNYDYKHKYLVEATFRYDGSSKFADGHKWSPFYGISGGWVPSEEKFMKNLSGKIDYLKIRASWGQMGNQSSIGVYDHISQVYTSSNYYPMGSSLSPVQQQYAYLGGMASVERGWEKIETGNIGLDISSIKNRLSASFDLYVKNNRNMFFNKEFPQVLGTTPPAVNGAHVRTKGWELTMEWKDRIGNIKYNVGFNLSNSTNKVVKLAETAIPGLGTNGFIEGYPVNSYFGFKYDGLIQNETELADYVSKLTSGIPNTLSVGDARYLDMDNDEKLESMAYAVDANGNPTEMSGDLVRLGDAGQHYLFGITLGANWKNFDFCAFFQGVLKWNVFDSNRPIMYDSWPPQKYFYGQYWNELHKDALYPRLSQNSAVKDHDYTVSDASYMYYNNSYIRLKNLQIGYTLPSMLTSRIKLERVRVYFSGTDIWEAYSIPGIFDPEKPFTTRITPMPRGFSFGINVTL